MTTLADAVDQVLGAQLSSGKPLAIVLAGHNGSGKSTMWYEHLAPRLQIPLVNADRMMLSILPDKDPLPEWAQVLRDEDRAWMQVAQRGVQAFIAEALSTSVPFAMETVFSHWVDLGDGKFESKIDQIRQMQRRGYFVLLIFVGLSSRELSWARVQTRVISGGHAVEYDSVMSRFPRTQRAIAAALTVAEAAILVDNSREEDYAFTVCRVQLKRDVIYDVRNLEGLTPPALSAWLDVVAPSEGA